MRSIQVPGDPSGEKYGIDSSREYRDPIHHLEVSGQAGDPGTDMAHQVKTALDKLTDVLHRSGYGLHQIARLGIFCTDVDGLIGLWPLVRERFAPGSVPPHTLLGVVRFAHPGVRIEFDATAVREAPGTLALDDDVERPSQSTAGR